MLYYNWDNEKSRRLKKERNICFEQIIMYIEKGNVLEIIQYPNNIKYPNQKVLLLNINDYIYLVPFVKNEKEIFLKTIIPSRKLTKKYLG